jgi:phasin family protein
MPFHAQIPTRKHAMIKTTQGQTEAFKSSTQAFLALSEVTFSGFERLSKLNLDTARSAFEDGMAASQSFAQVKDVNELKDVPSPFSRNATESFVTYFRNVQQIASELQEEIASIMTRQMSEFGNGGSGKNPFVDMVTKAAQQASDMTKATLESATDTSKKTDAMVVAQQKKSA